MAYPQYAGNGGVAAGTDDFVDVPYPATVNQYDILIATVLDADDDTFITPVGWNEVATVNGSLQSTVAVFWRRADGTETGVERFYSNSASGLVMGGVMARYTGCIRAGTPYESLATAGVTFSDTATLSAQTTTGIERLIVANIGIEDDKTIATATGYTQQYHLLDTTGSDFALGAQTQEVTSATTITAQTALLESGIAENWGTVSFSLIPTTKHALLGGINSAAQVAGDVKVKKHFEGAISASSAVSGNLHAHRGLAGAIAAAATVAGAITMQAALTGSIEAASSVAGDLKATYKLEGSIDAQSTVYGDLFRIGPTWSLEGHISEATDVYADSMYPIPQWTLVEEFVGRSLGDVMGYSSSQQFLAAAWTPTEDVTLGGIQVWLSQIDKLPPGTPISGAVWRDGGLGQGPEPWGEIEFSAMTERLADRIVSGTRTTGGALYTFEFGLYDPGKPRFTAGEKYWIVLYPAFGGTAPEETIIWQGNGVFNSRNERWYGDDLGETWLRHWNGTRYLRLFAAQNQVHSLQGSVAATSNISGQLLKNNVYYVRADGVASVKENATNPNGITSSMSPAVFESETFEPGDTIVWSAKGGPYEQVTVSNASSGIPGHPITIRGEFGGTGRPWIAGGIEVTGPWTQVLGEDRWWTPLVASPRTNNVVADGVDLKYNGEPNVTQPGEWYHNQFDDRLYMGGATSPAVQYSEIWVQKEIGPILELTGDNLVVEDLQFAVGRTTVGYPNLPAAGLKVSGSNVDVKRIGGLGIWGTALDAKNVANLKIDEADFDGGFHGLDISGATQNSGPIVQRSSFTGMQGSAVRIENQGMIYGQWISKVTTQAYERHFTLENMNHGLIEGCWMRPDLLFGADAGLGGVNVIGAVFDTVVRNCWAEGGAGGSEILAGIVLQDGSFQTSQVAFVHNLVTNAQNGVAHVIDSSDSLLLDVACHNNTVVGATGGFYTLWGAYLRISIRNNVFFNDTEMLDNPLGGFIAEGTSEQPTTYLSFANNHYRDSTNKPLTWFFKGNVYDFGSFAAAVTDENSFEQNPQIEDISTGKYWLASGSPAAGTGDSSVYDPRYTTAIVPGSSWPYIQVNEQEAPWNRGAFLDFGATGELELEGHIGSQSSVSGDLKLIPHELEGHIGAQASISGDLTILPGGAALPLAGSIGGKSNLYGDLFAPTTWSLEGHIASKAYFYADLYAPDRFALEGAIIAQSSVSGDLEQNFLLHLEGAIDAASALSGDLMHVKSIAGSIDAQSSLSGDLAQRMALEGAIAAQSVVSGDLTQIEALWELEGHIAAAAALSGSLQQIHALEGSIDAQSSLSGDLTQIEALWDLEGHVAAQSALSGHLGIKYPIAGAISAQSTVSGDLTQIEAVWELQGSIDAKSSFSGNLIVRQTLAPEDGGAQHAHRSQGAKEENVYVEDSDGSTNYGIKPGGQLLQLNYISRPFYSVTIFIARDQEPISTEWLRIRDYGTGGGGDLIIDESGTVDDLYRDDDFFVNNQAYDIKMILDEDATLSVWINNSLKWSGAVNPQALDFVYGRITFNTGADHQLEFHSWNYPTLDLLQHHFISIDDATHGHIAGEPNLVQNIDLFIDDALHGHTAEEPTTAVTHHLEIDDALHLSFAEELTLVEGIELSIDSATHGHQADEPTFTQSHVLAINDTAHYHITDPLALGGTGYLGINSAQHGHQSDNLDLVQHHALVIDSATHGHSADNVELAVTSYLAIDDSLHGHTADEPTFTQAHALGIDDALHGHLADEPTLAVTSYLSVDDALHGHQAENLDLVENIDLVIDDATHAHSADGLDIAVQHMLEIDDAAHSHLVENLDLTQGIALVIESASHAHDADGLTLAEKSLLEIQDTFHLHLADEVPIAGSVELVVDNAVHQHTADVISLQQTHVLEIDDCSHLHHADNLPISTVGILGIFSAKHGHSADEVTLGQAHTLAIDDAAHDHSADEPTLAEKSYLVIEDAAHGHTADPLDLDQVHVLAIDDCAHGHEAEQCNLTPTPILVIAKGWHSHWVDVVTFTQQHTLVIEDASHQVASDNLDIPQVHSLEIDDCSHEVTSPEVPIQHNHILVIDDCFHDHTSENLKLEEKSYLVIDDASHEVTSDEVTILVRYALEIDDASHEHFADNLDLSQIHGLAIEDAIHDHQADELELDTPWYQTQPAEALAEDACVVATVDDDAITATIGDEIVAQVHTSEEDCT